MDIQCPHCDHIQSDAHNGGDPGEWWHDQYIPDGECEIECDACRKEFIVVISWEPNFRAKRADEED